MKTPKQKAESRKQKSPHLPPLPAARQSAPARRRPGERARRGEALWRSLAGVRASLRSAPCALFLISAFCFPNFCFAGTFDCEWNSADFAGVPLSNKFVFITPLAPYGVDVPTSTLINRDRRRYTNDYAGKLRVNNMFNGRSYSVEFTGRFEDMVITNSFGTNVTGLVNAVDYLAAPINDAGVVAYSQASANNLFLTKSNGSGSHLTMAGTNTFQAISLGGEPRTNWPAAGGSGTFDFTSLSNVPPVLGNLATNNAPSLTNLNASSLASGTVPDARFPATLPVASGANLTALNASAIASGTLSPARMATNAPFSNSWPRATSATTAAWSRDGNGWTNLNASSLASGTIPDGRFPAGLTNQWKKDATNAVAAAIAGAILRSDGFGTNTTFISLPYTNVLIVSGLSAGEAIYNGAYVWNADSPWAASYGPGFVHAFVAGPQLPYIKFVTDHWTLFDDSDVSVSLFQNFSALPWEEGWIADNGLTGPPVVAITNALAATFEGNTSQTGTNTATAFVGDGSLLTALNAAALGSGTVPDARFPATLPAASGANLTALNASQLTSGTVPDARFPATLPAASGANLTALNATQLTSGTVPDARFPATLPAASAVNLTSYQSTNLVNTVKGAFSTNYTVVATDQILACTGTNQLVTLQNGTNGVSVGRMVAFLMSSTTGYGSAIITNANGVQTVLTAAGLSQTITNGQSLVLIWDGANWR